MSGRTWPEGVTGLDHTADVGLTVRAPTREDLFHRAAAGMVALLLGGADEGTTTMDRRPSPDRGDAGLPGSRRVPGGVAGEASRPTEHEVALDAPDLEMLLVAWLREILFLFQVEGFEYAGSRFDTLTPRRLAARVMGGPATAPELEMKGVTYHALTVRREDDGWFARVVFDV